MLKKKLNTTLKLFFVAFAAISMNAAPAFSLEEIIKPYRGIRSLGMGGALITTGKYDDTFFGNPARLAESGPWKISTPVNVTGEANLNLLQSFSKFSALSGKSGSDLVSEISNSDLLGKNLHARVAWLPLAYYSPRFISDKLSFAIGITTNTQTNILLRSTALIDIALYTDVNLNVLFGYKFLDDALNVGVAAHGQGRLSIDRSVRAAEFLAGKKIKPKDLGGAGIGADFDIGGYYKIPLKLPVVKLSVGGSVNNVLASQYALASLSGINERPQGNDRLFNLGVRADFPDVFILKDSHFALEVQDMGTSKQASFFKKLHMGGETRLIKFLLVRVGLNQGYPGGGLGIDLPIFKLDLATYGEEMGSNAGQLQDRRYLARIAIEI